VTEASGDQGTSITNAAEQIVAQLRAEYGERLTVIEHYSPRPSLSAEDDTDWTLNNLSATGVTTLDLDPGQQMWLATYDLVDLSPAGHAQWTRLTKQDVIRRIGAPFSG